MTKLFLVWGDALKALPALPSERFDLVLTDPPYNISRRDRITRKGGKFGVAKDISLYFGDWDFGTIRPEQYIPELVRVLKPHGVLAMFYDKLWLGIIGLWLQEGFNFKVRHIASWVKRNPAPQARKVKWQNGVENFLVATKNHGSGHHFNYKLGQSPDYFVTSVNYPHLHPTQKPLELFEWIVKYWSYPSDWVLDPFVGTGTTLVACAKLGRNALGIEIDPNLCEIARRRVKDEAGMEVKLVSLEDLKERRWENGV